jgi:hypothetical protein
VQFTTDRPRASETGKAKGTLDRTRVSRPVSFSASIKMHVGVRDLT